MKNILIKQVFKKFLIILSLLIIACIALNGLARFPYQDDFSLFAGLKDNNLFSFLKKMYLNWDGRIFTLSGFLQTFLIKYISFPIINMIWAVAFIVSSFFTVKILNIKNDKIIALSLISSALLLLFHRHAFQTIYWAVGGVYVFNLLIGTVWIYLYNKKKQLSLYICSLILGATTQNLVVCIITLILFDFIIIRLKTEKWDKEKILLLLLIIPGLLFISLAPGSLIRAEKYPEIDYSIISIVTSAINLFQRGLLISLYVLPFIPFISLFILKKANSELLKNSLLISIKYLLAALASVAIFSILPPELAKAKRIFIYFQYFLFLAMIFSVLSALQFAKKRFVIFTKYNNQLTIAGVTFLLLISLIVTYKNLEYGFHLKHIVKEREKFILQASNNTDVIIPRIEIQHGIFYFIHNFHDLTNDPYYFSNKDAAKYYNIKSIVVDPEINFNDSH